MIEEKARCHQCGSTAKLLFAARDLNRRITDEVFPYYRCSECGLVFLHPVPPELGRYYPSTYHEIPASMEELLRGSHKEAFKLEAVGPGVGRRLLEIGPSHGRFTALAKRAGFDVQVIEMDRECCQFIEKVIGIPAHLAQDAVAALDGMGRFNVIAMWHSLEHLRNPWEVIDALPGHMEKGGRLVIATPNPSSLQFRIFGSRWVHLDAPRHVNLIPHTILEARLAAARMRRVHFSTEDQGARECNLLGWIASFKTSIPRWHRHPLTSIAWRLSVPLSRLIERGAYGSAYTISFIKI
jgi:2-polyprenyl-3-methyl-5-hydroxy-6-metoxy-1,4-benzoquinol methylase